MNTFETARVDDLLGQSATPRGDHRQAARLHSDAAEAFHGMGMADREVEAPLRLGDCREQLGDRARARAVYEQAGNGSQQGGT